MQHKSTGRTIENANIIIVFHFREGVFDQLIVTKAQRGHPRSMCHKLIGKQGIVTDNVYLVTRCRMNDVINGNIPVEQSAMCVDVMILAVEEEAAASLRIKVPQQYAETAFCQETSQVNGCSGLAYATFDIIYGELFQKLKLVSKVGLLYRLQEFLSTFAGSPVALQVKRRQRYRKDS